MSKDVFGVKIYLNDRAAIVTADSTLGLYNVDTVFLGEVPHNATTFSVNSTTYFEVGDPVLLTSAEGDQENSISAINHTTKVLTIGIPLSVTMGVSLQKNIIGDSCFRWLQNDITGFTEDWKSGLLVEGGINTFSRKIDLSRGGNIAEPGSGKLLIKNTDSFFQQLNDRGLSLNGDIVKIYDFIDTTTRTTLWTGSCEEPSWDTRRYEIPLTGGLYNKRISSLATFISSSNYPDSTEKEQGGSVPITLGEIDKARFVRTAKDVTVFQINGKDTWDTYFPLAKMKFTSTADNAAWGDITGFAVIGDDSTTPPIAYNIMIVASSTFVTWYDTSSGSDVLITTGNYVLTDLIGQYIKVIDGSKSVGTYRRIENATIEIGATPTIFTLTLTDYFEETLLSNSTATIAGNAWVQIEKHAREYEADTWPCKDFMNSAMTATLTENLELYSYFARKSVSIATLNQITQITEEDENFTRLPEFAYTDYGDGDKNRISINVGLFENDPDEMNSFTVKPVENISLISDTGTLNTTWGLTPPTGNYYYAAPGYYHRLTDGTFTLLSGDLAVDTVDKIKTTNVQYHLVHDPSVVAGAVTINDCFAFKFDLPEIDFDFDACYLGINIVDIIESGNTDWNASHTKIKFVGRKYIGSPKNFDNDNLQVTLANRSDSFSGISLPDQYYVGTPDTKNKLFYTKLIDTLVLGAGYVVSGYKNYEITGITSQELYNATKQIGVFLLADLANNHYYIINEVAIIFKHRISIKDAVYTPFRGRIYNNTWGARKTSASLITNPVDQIEHVCRLQNGTENSVPLSSGWGKEYWSGAKIKTSGNGSFDESTDLSAAKGSASSGQVMENNDAYSDKIKRALCKNFRLANWIDENGYECIQTVKQATSASTDTITMADILDRKSIVLREPALSDIFPEPFVKYKKNYATDEFDSVIRITNTNYQNPTDAQKESFVEGITGGAAVNIWDKCHTLMAKVKQIEKPSSDLTDLEFIRTDSEARQYITDWVDAMFNKQIEFTAHFSKVGTWQECHRFKIQLPYHTSNVEIECILTEIIINPNNEHECRCKATMFTATIPTDFNLQDCMELIGGQYDWQDDMQTYVERGSGLDDRQDGMVSL